MKDLAALRQEMIERQLIARGIRDHAVLRAMREVPREEFVAPDLVEFAYHDAALPIEEQQTISQPFIVALMLEALELSAEDRVLEIGAGSGYAAAVLSRIAREVFTVERHLSLVRSAERRFRRLGYHNVHVLHADGTLGWPEHAPFDAILVSAGGPRVPQPLVDQLVIGGRLVIPTGEDPRIQKLLRVTRTSETGVKAENLGAVQFVPLIGAAGWQEEEPSVPVPKPVAGHTLPQLIAATAESFDSIQRVDLNPLLERIGNARVVLLGEATHGTSEFYEMRARITRELIERKGFNIVAVEADWPDAAQIDHYVRGLPKLLSETKPFTRFPTWMWANTDVANFVEWLKTYNDTIPDPQHKTAFYGLDLYSLYTSIGIVLKYLEELDPETAQVARKRYGCLTPWEGDPATYGAAVISDRYRACEREVVAMLKDLMARQVAYSAGDGQRFLDAEQNARLVASAERYYRVMYYGSQESWNLRDSHMFETLEAVLDFHGPDSKAVVWEHNSHIGDASATEMGAQGEHNVGQLARRRFGRKCYLIGFGTDHGTVAAASDWDGPMEIKDVRPALDGSYERLCHESGVPAFLLPLRLSRDSQVREQLLRQRLERAIGVIYRPKTELQSHYFYAILPRQFDEYIWFDTTRAITPLGPEGTHELPETFPFGI